MSTDVNRNTWILVADGSRARVFNYLGSNREPELIEDGEFSHSNLPSREIAQEKRGRVFHSADGSRSAMERPTDPHELEKTRFSARLSDFLHQQQQCFDRLVLVAAPKVLGDLRKMLSNPVMEKVDGEIDKDLTNIKASDLGKHLQTTININQ